MGIESIKFCPRKFDSTPNYYCILFEVMKNKVNLLLNGETDFKKRLNGFKEVQENVIKS